MPGSSESDFRDAINPGSLRVVSGFVEPALGNAQVDDKFQFERHGYFVADRVDHAARRSVFNRITGLKDGRGR